MGRSKKRLSRRKTGGRKLSLSEPNEFTAAEQRDMRAKSEAVDALRRATGVDFAEARRVLRLVEWNSHAAANIILEAREELPPPAAAAGPADQGDEEYHRAIAISSQQAAASARQQPPVAGAAAGVVEAPSPAADAERVSVPPVVEPSLAAELNLDLRGRERENADWCAILQRQDQNAIVGLQNVTEVQFTTALGDTDGAAARGGRNPSHSLAVERAQQVLVNGQLTYTQLVVFILAPSADAEAKKSVQALSDPDVTAHLGYQTHLDAIGIDMPVVAPAFRIFRKYCDQQKGEGPSQCVLAAIADNDRPFPTDRTWTARLGAACRRTLRWTKQDPEGGLIVAPDAGGGGGQGRKCEFGKVDVATIAARQTFSGVCDPDAIAQGNARQTLSSIMADWLAEGFQYLPRIAQKDLEQLTTRSDEYLRAAGPQLRPRIRAQVLALFPALNERFDKLEVGLSRSWTGWIGGGYFGQTYFGGNTWHMMPRTDQRERACAMRALRFFCDLLGFAYYHGTAFRAMFVYDTINRVAEYASIAATKSTAGNAQPTTCCQGGQLERLIRACGTTITLTIIAPRLPLQQVFDAAAAARPDDPWPQSNRKEWVKSKLLAMRRDPEIYGEADEDEPARTRHLDLIRHELRRLIKQLRPPNSNPDDEVWQTVIGEASGWIRDGYAGGGRRRRKRTKRQRHRRKKTKRRHHRRKRTKSRRKRRRRKTRRRRR